jgi:hypothetical protein
MPGGSGKGAHAAPGFCAHVKPFYFMRAEG